jgi:fluoride ion exporter CrcB/FEX
MTHGILLGLADILKGVAKTAIAATLPGLGSLVAAVLTGVEWLIKLIYRVAEILRVKDFLALARQKWEAEKARAKTISTDTLIEKGRRTETVNLRNAQTGQVSRSVSLTMGKQSVQVTVDKPTGIFEPNMSQGSFITDTVAFTEFYRKGCDASPLIAMLTLNSGICGSLMTLARMFDDTGEMIRPRCGPRAATSPGRTGRRGRSEVRALVALQRHAGGGLQAFGQEGLAGVLDPMSSV